MSKYDMSDAELNCQDQRFAAILVTVASAIASIITLAVWFLS